MADIVSSEKRSQMMAGIKGKNTTPELVVRKALHKKGFRYRINVKNLPGKPDIVFSKYRAVLFVNGCFWHGHDCHLFKWPSSRADFWKNKITRNQEVDQIAIKKLLADRWRVGVIWECSLRGKRKRSFDYIVEETVKWLLSQNETFQIRDSA
jgi:DNA mismatch endonuclease (patch repair protein)